jgi:hypothetical protein
MGNELSRLRAESFRESRKLDGSTFTVNGGSTSYTGIVASGAEMKALQVGGFMLDYDKQVDYLPSEITLAVGDKVTSGGKVYRVTQLNGDGEPIWTANLTGVDK